MIIQILYPTPSVTSCPLCAREFRQLLNHLRIAKHVSKKHPRYKIVLKCPNCRNTFKNTRFVESHKCEAQPNIVDVVKVRLEGGSAIYPYPRGPMGCSLCPWLSKALFWLCFRIIPIVLPKIDRSVVVYLAQYCNKVKDKDN